MSPFAKARMSRWLDIVHGPRAASPSSPWPWSGRNGVAAAPRLRLQSHADQRHHVAVAIQMRGRLERAVDLAADVPGTEEADAIGEPTGDRGHIAIRMCTQRTRARREAIQRPAPRNQGSRRCCLRRARCGASPGCRAAGRRVWTVIATPRSCAAGITAAAKREDRSQVGAAETLVACERHARPGQVEAVAGVRQARHYGEQQGREVRIHRRPARAAARATTPARWSSAAASRPGMWNSKPAMRVASKRRMVAPPATGVARSVRVRSRSGMTL